MKPKILITLSNISEEKLASFIGDTDLLYSDRKTGEAVYKAGGSPLYMPTLPAMTQREIKEYIDQCDGVVLTGAMSGVNPYYYREERAELADRVDDKRDRIDMQLVRFAYEQNKPVLGICKGMQIINVALGGSLYQDLKQQLKDSSDHNPKKENRKSLTHKIKIMKHTKLGKQFKDDLLYTNGGHKQAIKKLADSLEIVGQTEDGVIEMFEAKNRDFFVGVQFHPELDMTILNYKLLFETFMIACRSKKENYYGK